MGSNTLVSQLSPFESLATRMHNPNNIESAIQIAIQEDNKLKTYRMNNPVNVSSKQEGNTKPTYSYSYDKPKPEFQQIKKGFKTEPHKSC